MDFGKRQSDGAERRLRIQEGGLRGAIVGSRRVTSSRSHGTALNMPPARTNENSSPVNSS